MEKTVTKLYVLIFVVSSAVWLYSSSMLNYHTGTVLKFGTVEFKSEIDPGTERSIYSLISKYSIISLITYPFVFLAGIGFVTTTRRSFKENGWLLMSVILFFIFVPVEIYCFWLDWKIVGLNYWGEWPLEEFRKALLNRITALAGLPLIAQLCYFTIPIFIIFKPLRRPSAL